MALVHLTFTVPLNIGPQWSKVPLNIVLYSMSKVAHFQCLKVSSHQTVKWLLMSLFATAYAAICELKTLEDN